MTDGAGAWIRIRPVPSLRPIVVVLPGLVLLLAGETVRGQWEITPSLTLGTTYTDNVELDRDDPQAENTVVVSPAVQATIDGRRFDADADYRLESYFYGEDSGPNPWEATTLEWQTPDTPPHHGNWGPELPVVYRWAYDYSVPGAVDDYIPQNKPSDHTTGESHETGDVHGAHK